MHVEVCILHLVLVVTTTVLYDGSRVGERICIVVAVEFLAQWTEKLIIVREQTREASHVLVILIWSNERRLDKSKVGWRCNRALTQVRGKAIIKQSVVSAGKRHIKPCGKVP